MPSVTIKLIGYQNNSEYNHKIVSDDDITLKYIYLEFMKAGLHIDKIKMLKFICNGNTLTVLDKVITNSNNINMFIFTNDDQIKQELFKYIFKNIPKEELLKNSLKLNLRQSNQMSNLPIDDNLEEIYNPSSKEISQINIKIMEIFKNKDFVNTLRICKNKPDILKMVNSYLVNGDISTKIKFDNLSLENFEFNEEFLFLVNYLKNDLNSNLDSELSDKIKKVLIHFKGHINLSLRYILNEFNSNLL